MEQKGIKAMDMKIKMIRWITLTALATTSLLFAGSPTPQTEQQRLAEQIRKQLVTLPYYGVFDDLSFRLDGRKVILTGQVTRPTLASSAANVTKSIPGVEEVENRIEVLPLSPNDDRIRLAVYRNVFGQASLGRYTLGAVPSIHILVKNGNVTLAGRVINEMDKNLANIFANQVAGVFSVTNQLVVE